ncbi:hypothetical protein DSO57_1017168 [Entomophthora muscae]|uniref:Uncharacterized protein n=1 Tax=Entomophthora muscae TaxID=34485 RepID=A0ACC2RW49_9FUNG|nr:hypothetical protein DSO57_1017168 [Entomophthora muscae]
MFSDPKLDIFFDTPGAQNSTADLLKFNCPYEGCKFVSKEGYLVLKAHASSEHNKNFCDLCVTHKRVFYCEHLLYSRDELQLHIKRGSPIGKKSIKKKDDGFRGHPYCAFCKERFYDSDALFEHCRKNHEECFLCKRENPADRSQYQNYQALENHFSLDHYLCKEKECLDKRFIVFSSEIDLQAHTAEEHSDKLAGFQRVRQKQARQINFNVTFTDRNQEGASSSQPRARQNGHEGSRPPAHLSEAENSRRIRAPAGFGISSFPQTEQPIHSEPAPSSHSYNPAPDQTGASWPSLDGSTVPASALSTLPASRSTKGRSAAKNDTESWPGLPSTSRAAVAKPTAKPKDNLKQYSKQLLDKRPPLPKQPAQPIVLPPPLPSAPASSSKDFIVPFSLQNTVSGFVLRKAEKLDVFLSLVELFRSGTIGASEFVGQLDALFQQSGSNTTKLLSEAMSKTVSGLVELLDKSLSKSLSNAYISYRSKVSSFPELPSALKPSDSQPTTRKVLVIKEKSKVLPRPVKKPVLQPAQPIPGFPSLPSSSQSNLGLLGAGNGSKPKGKKVVWTNL